MRDAAVAVFCIYLVSALLAVCVWGEYPDVWWFPFAITATFGIAWRLLSGEFKPRSVHIGDPRTWVVLIALFLALQATPLTGESVSVAPAQTIRFLGWFLTSVSSGVILVEAGGSLRIQDRIPLLIAPVALIGGIEALTACGQRLHQDFDELSTGTFVSHASLSCFLCALLPLATYAALHYYARGEKLFALVSATVTVLVAGGILASLSRVGWLFLATFTVLMLIRYAKTHRVTAAISAVILGGVLFFSVSPQFLESRFDRLSSWSGLRHDLNVTRWDGALQLFSESPMLGIGAGAFPVAYSSRFLTHRNVDVPASPSAENDYLQVLSEVGLVGFTLYVGLAVTFLRPALSTLWFENRRQREYFWAIVASLIAIALHCVFDRQISRPPIAIELAWICALMMFGSRQRSSPYQR